jgi:hypothetical protein
MRSWVLAVALLASLAVVGTTEEIEKKKHHKRHHHKHHKGGAKSHSIHDEGKVVVHAAKSVKKEPASPTKPASTPVAHVSTKSKAISAGASEQEIMSRMRALEGELAVKEKAIKSKQPTGPATKLEVNGPLPVDFATKFAQAVSKATGSSAADIRVVSTNKVAGVSGDVREIQFVASPKVAEAVQDQAADPDSKLANGALHSFLVAKGEDDEPTETSSSEETPVREDGIDIDTAMPYGELEPFGREDTAQELTEQSVKESDEMVDQLERAEVAEEKRAVFRALTRLRGAAITSFDGIARSQTGNIDEYNKLHKWRRTHPLHHLADEESDISKWAFPDNADF